MSWTDHTIERPSVEVPGFPAQATGFAVFKGRELQDVCLLAHPVAQSGLFDSLAFYDGAGTVESLTSEDEAVEIVQRVLGNLPVREKSESGAPPDFWLECGIHNGQYEVGSDGLHFLRLLMLPARTQWVD